MAEPTATQASKMQIPVQDNFARALEQSKAAVMTAAGFLSDRGYPVMIPPVWVRPHARDREDYSDHGDLFIQLRVEVKHRRLAFTDRDSYKFDTIIVDRKSSFDRLRPAAYCYFIFNWKRTHFALINVRETYEQWSVVFINGKEYYQCPKGLAGFHAVE